MDFGTGLFKVETGGPFDFKAMEQDHCLILDQIPLGIKHGHKMPPKSYPSPAPHIRALLQADGMGSVLVAHHHQFTKVIDLHPDLVY